MDRWAFDNPTALPNDDAQFWGAFSNDAGIRSPRTSISSLGGSNSHAQATAATTSTTKNGGPSCYWDRAYRHGPTTRISNGDQPDGALPQLDSY